MNPETQPWAEIRVVLGRVGQGAPNKYVILAVMSTHGGHSANVKMRLLLDGRVLPVAQLGPDFLILDQGVEHPPATAEIVLTVDDHQKRWTVGLPNGIQPGRTRVPIATV